MVVDAEIWILATVPALAVVALADYFMSCSRVISSRVGISNPLWVHIAILLLILAAIVWLLSGLDDVDFAFSIKDYLHPERHWLLIDYMPKLLVLDAILLSGSVLSSLLIAIVWRRSFLLGVVASILGNVGSVVWLYANRKPRAVS